MSRAPVGVRRQVGNWSGTAWPAAGAARTAVSHHALQDSTNAYRYALDVTAYYDADSATSRMTGRIAVVNRSSSVFGAAGGSTGSSNCSLIRPGTPGCGLAATAACGGTRRARRPNHWAAAPIDRPDTRRRPVSRSRTMSQSAARRDAECGQRGGDADARDVVRESRGACRCDRRSRWLLPRFVYTLRNGTGSGGHGCGSRGLVRVA